LKKIVVAVYDKALEYVDHANAQQSLSRLWRHQHSIAPFSTSSLWQNEESFYHYYKHRLKPLISSDTFFLRSSYIISSGLYNDREIISFYARSASGRAFSFFGAAEGEANSNNHLGAEGSASFNSIRSDFKSLLAWYPNLTSNSKGEVEIPIKFADNLTEWRVAVWAIDEQSRFGHTQTEITVSQDIISRPVLPRYLTTNDRARVSSITHNYTNKEQPTQTSFNPLTNHLTTTDSLSRSVVLNPKNGESIQHWNVIATKSGKTQLQFPSSIEDFTDTPQKDLTILPYGVQRQDSVSFDLNALNSKSFKTDTLALPELVAEEQSKLSIRYSPSVQASLSESIPYLFDFEHGCAEQTVNRFVPAALCHQLLQSTPKKSVKLTNFLLDNITIETPQVIETKDIALKLKSSIFKLRNLQTNEGGWSWFGQLNTNDNITNIVLYGLIRVKESDFEDHCDNKSTKLLNQCIDDGVNYLEASVNKFLKRPLTVERLEDSYSLVLLNLTKAKLLSNKNIDWKDYKQENQLFDFIYEHRSALPLKSLSQLAIVAKLRGNDHASKQLFEDVRSMRTEISIENNLAHAWALKAYLTYQPDHVDCLKIAKQLLNNRTNGSHWSHTIDTSACVDALASYATIQKEKLTDKDIDIILNKKKIATLSGAAVKQLNTPLTIQIGYQNITRDTLSIVFNSKQNLSGFGSATLSYLWQPKKFTPKESPLKVKREYFLVKKNNQKQPLKSGDKVKVGDTLSVKITVINPEKNKYLHIKVPKPAGLVHVDKISGYIGNNFQYYRDPQLTHSNLYTSNTFKKNHSAALYTLKAETVGVFTALPAEITAMYKPEINNHTESFILEIVPNE